MPAEAFEALSFDQFAAAESAWDDLVESSAHPTPFMTHAWLRTWWKHFGEGLEFLGLVVRDGGDGDRWTAAVPLSLRPVRLLGASFTVAEIVGTGPVPTRGMGLSDKADLVVRIGEHEAGEKLIVGLLALLRRVDVLDLKGFSEDSFTAGCFGSAVASRSVSPYLTLPATWDEYARSRSQKFRKNLKKYRRFLQERGELSIERMSGADDVDVWMQQVLDVNEASWKSERGTNLFRSPALRGFFLDLASEMAVRGRLDLHMLRVDGLPVAYELGFDVGNRIFAYNAGFRGDFAGQSPGNVVMAAVIESACARGRTEYDMLRGGEAYKARWSETTRRECQVALPASRLKARGFAALAIRLKARLKRSGTLVGLADRASGWLNRLRFRG